MIAFITNPHSGCWHPRRRGAGRGGEARSPGQLGRTAAASARLGSTLPAPRRRPPPRALLGPPACPALRPGGLPETRGARRHGWRPPPPAGERAASGDGVRPRRALPGAGRAAQPGRAGGRQSRGGHVSGRALGAPGSRGPAWPPFPNLGAVEGSG